MSLAIRCQYFHEKLNNNNNNNSNSSSSNNNNNNKNKITNSYCYKTLCLGLYKTHLSHSF